jgi:hypothetical protein
MAESGAAARGLLRGPFRFLGPGRLALATDDGRILVTRNSRDFAPICRHWPEAARPHAGVILIWTLSQRQYDGIERRLREMPAADAWQGVVVAI